MEPAYTGTLVGLAAGDAMGSPLEYMSANQIQIKLGTVTKMAGGGWLNLRAGEYTNETILTMALAESLIEKKGLDVADIAARYVDWHRTGPKDAEGTMRASLALIEEGTPVAEASRQAHFDTGGKSATHGTVTRCAPIALAFHPDRHRIVVESLAEARITHYDKKSGSGSAALGLLLSVILEGETDKVAVLQMARDLLANDAAGAHDVMPDPRGKLATQLRPSSYVVDALEVALSCFVEADTFRDAVVRAVNLGGESGATGALTGALCGCYHGIEGIPADWRAALQDAGILAQLGRGLLRLTTSAPV